MFFSWRKEGLFLKQRVISAVVMLAITFFCIFISPIVRVIFFAACGIACAYELSKNFEKLDARCTLWVMVMYLGVETALVIFHAGLGVHVVWFVFCLYTSLFSGIIHRNVGGKGALYTLAGLTYPCVLFSVLMLICVSDIWFESLAFAALSTWICDSFALFGGVRFGKHKVAPLVSPNKTVEGCLCGALSSLVTGLLLWFLSRYFTPVSLWVSVVTCLAASSMGQIGDLAESLIKRMIGVKDFSNLIPGHGGMFDRVDSLLFSIPTAFICLHLFL